MHDHPTLIFAALLIFVYGLVSRLSERSPLTGPIIFMGVGILVSPLGLGLFDLHVKAGAVKLLAEVTLIIILFVDATQIRVKDLIHTKPRIALRLLGIGLPLTMLLGFLFALPLFDHLSLWALALLALILSPTDAALGQAVIKSPDVPNIMRRAISVESGLNDGIALPPIFLCIAALAVIQGISEELEGGWGLFMLQQLSLGLLVGVAVGWIGGKLIESASYIKWMDPMFQRLAVGSLAILAFVFAELVGGNGFIAAFCGGLFLGTKDHEIRERMQEFGEAEGLQLSLFVFLIFGMTAVPIASNLWSMNDLIYALLSLTVIRMLPVILSLSGTGLDLKSKAFIGWFGPRGIASVLYLLIVVDQLGVKGSETILSVIVLTIMLSVILHGITAMPFTKIFRGDVHQ